MKHGPRSIRWLEFMLAISVVSLVLQLGWASILSWLNRPRAGVQVAQQFKGMDYWLYLPQAHGQSDESWPLLLFLHGAR